MILTAGFGDGHNAAARNVGSALEQAEGIRSEVRIVDIFDLAYPGISRFLKNTYRFGITHFPSAWEKAYHLSDSISYKNDSLGVFRKAMLGLKRLLEEWQPQAVVNTYPFYSQLLEAIVGRFQTLPFSVTTVITDAVSINQTWLSGRTDTFVVGDPKSAAVLVSLGTPAEKIRTLGFPVAPVFERLAAVGLPDDRFQAPARLLYLPATPKNHVRATLRGILEVAGEMDLRLTVVLGRHARRLGGLMRRWEERFPAGALDVIGWTTEIPRLLREHHVIIGKAGGASVQEAMAAHRPLLVNYVVPGQEEGNAMQIAEAGCGRRIGAPSEIAPALRDIFANGGRLWREMCGAAAANARPEAARRIAEMILAKIPAQPDRHP